MNYKYKFHSFHLMNKEDVMCQELMDWLSTTICEKLAKYNLYTVGDIIVMMEKDHSAELNHLNDNPQLKNVVIKELITKYGLAKYANLNIVTN